MELGPLTLQGEKETLLARQIVYTVLTGLRALLRVVYLLDKASQVHPVGPGSNEDYRGGRGTLYGREAIGALSQCLSRIPTLPGRLCMNDCRGPTGIFREDTSGMPTTVLCTDFVIGPEFNRDY